MRQPSGTRAGGFRLALDCRRGSSPIFSLDKPRLHERRSTRHAARDPRRNGSAPPESQLKDSPHGRGGHAMQKITPFLWFDSNAEDAAKFYASVFPKSKIVTTTRYGPGGPGPAGSVMTVEFELDGQRFVGLNGGPKFKFSEAISFVVNVETQAELDALWDKLLQGGGRPDQCGWLKDRFGLS